MQKKVACKPFLIFAGIILFLIGFFLRSTIDFVLDSPTPLFNDAKFEIFEDPGKPPVAWPSLLSDSTCLKVTVRKITKQKILGDEMRIEWYPESGRYRVELLEKNGKSYSVSSRSVVSDDFKNPDKL